MLKALGVNFQNKKLLEEALTHPSVKRISKTNFSYQRLEFLGDKVLSLVIANFLISRFANEAEGELSKRHAFLVARPSLVLVAKSLNLGEYLIISENQVADGGRNNENILENTLEALIGAIFLDAGFFEAEKFIIKFFAPLLNNFDAKAPQDAKSAFQEWFQKKHKKLPEYITIGGSGDVGFEVLLKYEKHEFKGHGKTIKEAEKSAALNALKMLKIL